MRLIIDTDEQTIREESATASRSFPLHSPEAFRLISRQWVVVGWSQKYSYGFSWMGRPIIQLPEDVMRIQEVVHCLKPDVIIETGVAHGGSLIFYASLCKAMDCGRVIGIDIEIRPHNRSAIEAHPLAQYITLIEGSSTDVTTVQQVKEQIRPDDRVLVLLDSCHTKAHVLEELHTYAPLVSVGSYIVATDGIMFAVADCPNGKADWTWDNPTEAVREFAGQNKRFRIEDPESPFNESAVSERVTHWPSAYLRRVA